MTRAWWLLVGGVALAPLVGWLPMLTMAFPNIGLPAYKPIEGMYFWWDHVYYLVFLGAIAWLVGQTDRWLGAAIGLAAITFFLRGALMDPSTSVVFATGALLLTAMRQAPARWHTLIRRVIVGSAIFQLLYVGHQMLGYDVLWAGMWGVPTSAVVQPIGTLGTVDGVGAYLAITAPLMPLWLLPFVIYAVWHGHSLSALLALMVGLVAKALTNLEAVVVHPRAKGSVWILWRRQARYAMLVLAGLGVTAFASMAYLKGLRTESVFSRFVLWVFGLEYAAKTTPVLGLSLGGWFTRMPEAQIHYGIFPTPELWRQAHNEYVQWIVETGVVGLVLLCGWLWCHRAMVLDRAWGPSCAALAVNAIGFFPLHVVPIALVSIICVGLATPTLAHERSGG